MQLIQTIRSNLEMKPILRKWIVQIIIQIIILATYSKAMSDQSRLFKNKEGTQLINFYKDPRGYLKCKITTEINDESLKLLASNKGKNVQILDQTSMNMLTTFCQILGNPYLLMVKTGSLIYPGTKWCGPGDIAEGYNDIGILKDSDLCCREHDNCPEDIKPGEEKYGIKNPHFSTMSLCTCDDKFKNCLKNLHDSDADKIGTLYFNIFEVPCFDYGYPLKTLTCSTNENTMSSLENCKTEFEFDTEKQKNWRIYKTQPY